MVEGLRAGDPQSMGPYRLLGRLGAGGMGQVFLGRSAGGRLVAVKVIRPELAGEPGFRARFAREVAAARTVCGLFTAPVADADVQGPVPWLATAYVAGPSLADAVDAQGPLPVTSVLTLAAGLAEGLEAIHAAGLVHRDLKPSNVLLAEDGPRVIDFGISRAAEASVLTQTGTVMGSPGFMSPEQAQGRAVGPPSDVFSLGAVLTFAATGQGPFGTGATPALLYRVVHQQPDTAGLPKPIRPLVERCLAKDPGQRPATTALLAALGNPQPAEDWLPAPLTDVFSRYVPPPPGSTGGPPTTTGAVPRRTSTEAAFPAQPPAGDGQPGRAPTQAAFRAQTPNADAQPGRAPTGAAFLAQPPAGVGQRGGAPSEAAVRAQPPGGAGQPSWMPSEAAFRAQPPGGDGQPPRKKRRGLAWALLATALLAVLVAAAIVVPKVIWGSPVSHTQPPAPTSGTPSSPSSQPSQNGGAVSQSATPTVVPPPSSPVQSPSSPASQPPATTQPSTTGPVTTEPVTTPVTTQPVTTEPVTTTPPSTTEPATTQPAATSSP
jgi:serine/threonine protein kinase